MKLWPGKRIKRWDRLDDKFSQVSKNATLIEPRLTNDSKRKPGTRKISFHPNIGAVYIGNDKCNFRTWAPLKNMMEIMLVQPERRIIPMNREERGYWSAEVDGAGPGTRYYLRLDGEIDRPDPASFFQPEGVHGPSEIINLDFDWQDDEWKGRPIRDCIFYEIHVGTFTPEGSFEAVIGKLDYLVDLGITSLEVMPIAQFPGGRNWGYDGVYPFAVQNSYGGLKGFLRLVDACHQRDLSVTLDVVYNHLGPEGNYLRDFGPYFTQRYATPWGDALNFDGAYSDHVRNFFTQNALFWFNVCHVDILRLDAVHAIYDFSAVPFLAQLADKTVEYGERTGKNVCLVAESDLNDSRLVRPKEVWGYGIDAQWSDDFHHALHSLLTGEREEYYLDFGKTGDLVKALTEGYVYSGRYSEFRQKNHGNYSADLPSDKFVVAAQNHDQIGNRMLGERLSKLIPFDAQKVAAAVLLLSPFVPLLFMGEEYGEEAPFLYFVSHSEPGLIEAVRRGRKEEFKNLTPGEPPDPESLDTFLKSRLDWNIVSEGSHRLLADFYKVLIRMRRKHPALLNLDRKDMEVRGFEDRKLLLMRRRAEGRDLFCIFNLDSVDHALSEDEIGPGSYRKILDSAESAWGGPGSLLPEKPGIGPLELKAYSVAVFSKE